MRRAPGLTKSSVDRQVFDPCLILSRPTEGWPDSSLRAFRRAALRVERSCFLLGRVDPLPAWRSLFKEDWRDKFAKTFMKLRAWELDEYRRILSARARPVHQAEHRRAPHFHFQWNDRSLASAVARVGVQDGPKMAKRGPRWPQDGQEGPKMATRWPKMAPRWPQDGPKMAP